MSDSNLGHGAITISGVPAYIDHTLLKPDASTAGIHKLCREAVQHNFYSVCVNGYWVPFCREELVGSDVKISAVVGFPLGASASPVKAFEAARGGAGSKRHRHGVGCRPFAGRQPCRCTSGYSRSCASR